MIQETIYEKLVQLLPEIEEGALVYRKLNATPGMSVDVSSYYPETGAESPNGYIMTLSQKFQQPGHPETAVAAPVMELEVAPLWQMAAALNYRDRVGYRSIYRRPEVIDKRTQEELNCFLDSWVSMLLPSCATVGV